VLRGATHLQERQILGRNGAHSIGALLMDEVFHEADNHVAWYLDCGYGRFAFDKTVELELGSIAP